VRRVLVCQVDEIGADRLDAEDLHAAVSHPVYGLSGDPAEAVQEGRRPGGVVVVVGAEEQDVALLKFLTTGLDGCFDLRRGHVMAALVLPDVDADRVAAEGVERHLGDRRAALLVVAEGVDVGGGVVRGDDDLGVERGPALLRVGMLDVAQDLRRGKERVQLRFP
jgi:hypothetical protein